MSEVMVSRAMQVCLLLIPTILLIGTAFFLPEGNQATSSTDMNWLLATPLPRDLVSHCSVVYSDTIYIVGGAVQSENLYSNVVYSAEIKPSGEINAWATRPLTGTDSLFNVSVTGSIAIVSEVNEEGWIYVMGGYQNRAASGDTHYAKLTSETGSVGDWNVATPTLPARYYFAAVEYNGDIYALGGLDAHEETLRDVSYTSVGKDGSIEGWTTTTPLTTSVAGHSAVEYNEGIYVIGGFTKEGTNISCANAIYSATIMSSGGLSNWQRTSSLPAQTNGCLCYHMAVVSGHRLYLIGGMVGREHWNDKVYRAPFNPDGTLGDWEVLTSTETEISDHSVVVDANGRIYVLGGMNNCGSRRDVYYTPLLSLSKSSDPLGEVKCADLITYTTRYAANMPGITLTNVVITDLVPSNVMLDRSSISDGGYECDGVIIWDNLEDFSIESGVRTVSFRVKVSETECGYDDPPTPTPTETSAPLAISTTAYAPMCPKATPTCTCTDPIVIINRAWISSDQESREASFINSPLGIYLPIILKSGD